MKSAVILAALTVLMLTVTATTATAANVFKDRIVIEDLSNTLKLIHIARIENHTFYSVKEIPCLDDNTSTNPKVLPIISELNYKIRPYGKKVWCITVEEGREGYIARIYLKSGADKEVAEIIGRRALTVNGISRVVVIVDDIGLATLNDSQALEIAKRAPRDYNSTLIVKNVNGVIVFEAAGDRDIKRMINILTMLNETRPVLVKPIPVYVELFNQSRVQHSEVQVKAVKPVETVPPAMSSAALRIDRIPGIIVSLAAIIIGLLGFRLVG